MWTCNIIRRLFILCLTLWSGSALAQTSLDGTIVVKNNRRQSMVLSIDGENRGQVKPNGRVQLVNVPNGIRLLSFSTQRGKTETHRVTVPVGGTVQFAIKKIKRRVVFTNPNTRDFWISIAGHRLGRIGAKRSRTFRISTGEHEVKIKPVGMSHALPLSQRIVVHRDVRATIQLQEYFSALRIEGRSLRNTQLLIDGHFQSNLTQDHVQIFREIPSGTRVIEIRRGKRVLHTKRISFRRGQMTTWKINKRDKNTQPNVWRDNSGGAELVVINRQNKPVSIQIDGGETRTIRAQSTLTVPGLNRGRHTIEWRGGASGVQKGTAYVGKNGGRFAIDP